MQSSSIKIVAPGKLAISGELTLPSATLLYQQFSDFTQLKATEVEIDLRAVTQSDSAGVALLVALLRLARRQNCRVVFSNVPQQIQIISAMSGLEQIIPLKESLN